VPVRLVFASPARGTTRGETLRGLPAGGDQPMENIVVIVVIVLIVLFVLGYFGRGRMRG
jgi:hypothetical protein